MRRPPARFEEITYQNLRSFAAAVDDPAFADLSHTPSKADLVDALVEYGMAPAEVEEYAYYVRYTDAPETIETVGTTDTTHPTPDQ